MLKYLSFFFKFQAKEAPPIIPSPFNDYWRSLVLNGQELNIDDIPVNVSIDVPVVNSDVPVVNSEERNEPELESVSGFYELYTNNRVGIK